MNDQNEEKNTILSANRVTHASPCVTWPPKWLAEAATAPPPKALEPAPEPADIEPKPVEPAPAIPASPDPVQPSTVHHKPVCRCGSHRYVDVPIHGGQSLRRDCADCSRFIAFVLWYGRLLHPSEN